MADNSSHSTQIQAPIEQVREILFNLEGYPSWSSAIKTVEVLERDSSSRPTKLTLKVEAGVLKDRPTLVYDWSKAPNEISFSLEEADLMTQMDGKYEIKDNGDDSVTVTYSLTTALSMPVPDLMRRKVEKTTIEQSLSELKQKLEG
ncbi:MAG: polyketide cyclase / dehydrase and lipid transport [Actinobacteria bacterium]|nr:polyketide cyclase / dehydrase and lipid transport [Actinomycetota bacterium]